MAWKSGTSRYLVRESPAEVVAGVREALRRADIQAVESTTRRGIRLCLATPRIEEGLRIPAFVIGVVELRFTVDDGATEVTVRGRQTRRWWTLAVFAGLGVASVLGDLIAAMGFLTLELGRSMREIQARHRAEDPRVLHTVAGFLGPRDIGRLSNAPFRRALSK